MKNLLCTIQKLICVSISLFASSTIVWAAGNHADGHAHGDTIQPIGKPGIASNINRVITIDMTDDMRYTPSALQVKQGETIRFIVRNKGQVKHEMSLGTQQELLEHLEQMKKFPGMEHDEPSTVALAPGKQGEMIWQFTQAGTVNFACLMPGHYEAGMQGKVQVAKH